MLVCVTIDECFDFSYLVVRQLCTADNVCSNLPRCGVPVYWRPHVQHWYLANILRTSRLGKSRVTNESRLSAVLANYVKFTEK